jgi:hypothetical protein
MTVYISKHSFVEVFSFSLGYYIVVGFFKSFYISNFIVSRSHVKFIWNSLSKIKDLLNSTFQIMNIKGIGYKVYYYVTDHSVYFNIGYNHFCRYFLGSSLFVKVRKQHLLLYSSPFYSGLNIHANEIFHLRYPDPYRGKGIRPRNFIFLPKPGKQR